MLYKYKYTLYPIIFTGYEELFVLFSVFCYSHKGFFASAINDLLIESSLRLLYYIVSHLQLFSKKNYTIFYLPQIGICEQWREVVIQNCISVSSMWLCREALREAMS